MLQGMTMDAVGRARYSTAVKSSNRLLGCVAALLLGLALTNAADAAVRKGSTVRITLQNGTVLIGDVVSETSQGLLISNGSKTELVPFTNVKNLDDLTPGTAAPTRPAASGTVPPPPPPPPPLSDDEAPRPRRAANAEPAERKVRFGVGVSAGAAPAYYGVAWGVGAEFVTSFNFTTWFHLRLLANYTHTENGPYSTNLGLAIVTPIIWFGVYGLGVALAVGAGDVSRRGFGAAIGAFASPVRLKFGNSITHEFSLDIGAIVITSSSGVDPFGRISYTVFF